MAVATTLAALTSAPAAQSEPAKSQSGPETKAPVVLVCGSLPWSVDKDDLRAALARELGVDVLDAPPASGKIRGTLSVSTDDGKATARFETPAHVVTQRTVTLPADRDRAIVTIVVLAGNVARDEAAELRAELARRAAGKGDRPGAPSPAPDDAGRSRSDSDAPDGPASLDDSDAPDGPGSLDGSDSDSDSDAPDDPDAGPGSDARGDRDKPSDQGAPDDPDTDLDSDSDSGSPDAADTDSPARSGAHRGSEEGRPRPHGRIRRRAGGARARAPSRAQAPSRADRCAVGDDRPVYFAGADFVPMLGTSLAARDAVLHASLDVIGGLAGGVRGVQIGSVFNIVTGPVCGLQIAGVTNIAEHTTGLQISGVAAAAQSARGLQISGVANAVGDVRGLQIAGVTNVVGDVRGLQIAGAVNATRSAAGLQIAGVANGARDASGLLIGGAMNVTGPAEGLLIAGAMNLSDTVNGGQIGGALNLASGLHGFQLGALDVAGSVDGAQVGAVNVAGRVRGVQIGVVNVAEESDVSVGVVSIVRRGRSHLDVWGSESGLFMAAFKHGGRYFHNLYGVGIRPFGDQARLAFNLGVGGHIPLTRTVFVDIDGLAYSLHRANDFAGSTALVAQLRSMVGVRITEGIALVAGPSYNVSFAGTAADADLGALGSALFASTPGLHVRGWPGANLGVQMF